MKEEEDAQDLIEQLQRLQIEQNDLLARLSNIQRKQVVQTVNKDTKTPPNTTREFVVGDRVRIKNPGRFQANKGEIKKIGKERITIQASNGTLIVRAPKNLALRE